MEENYREDLAWGRKRVGRSPPDLVREEKPVRNNSTIGAITDRRIRLAEPYVRQVREEVFGSPDPPWVSPKDEGAVAWFTERGTLTIRGGRIPSRLRQVNEAVQTIADGAGFTPADVERWILYGNRPTLSRVILRVHATKRALPTGGTLRRKWATVTLHAPVKESEIKSIWRRLNSAWTAGKGEPDAEAMVEYHREGQKRQRTPEVKQRELLDWVERTPGTWEEKAKAWAEEHGPVKPNTLYYRWKRAKEKLDSLEPQED